MEETKKENKVTAKTVAKTGAGVGILGLAAYGAVNLGLKAKEPVKKLINAVKAKFSKGDKPEETK